MPLPTELGGARLVARPALLALVLLLAWPAARAEVYRPVQDFIAAAFGGNPPPPRLLWLSGALRRAVTDLLGHPPTQLRVRYWLKDRRSAWVLDEIGKERPITVGIVVDGDAIARLEVLAFRESRGWEVRVPAFTRQFRGARLEPDTTLDRRIDGITGATLSVRALTRLARLALYLHTQVTQ